MGLQLVDGPQPDTDDSPAGWEQLLSGSQAASGHQPRWTCGSVYAAKHPWAACLVWPHGRPRSSKRQEQQS